MLRRGAFAERFEVLRVLGEGSFGLVEEALDHHRGLRVAVKSLKRLGGSARERFKSEFRGLTDLTHPNLPLFFELFTEGDDWFFTMELIEGVPLDAWVRGEVTGSLGAGSGIVTRSLSRSTTAATHEPAGGAAEMPCEARSGGGAAPSFSEPRLRSALEQLRDVLSFLHGRGYVHRDLKPSNVRVREDGRLMLLDFGLSARVGDVEDHFVGTVAYAAPEQAQGGPATTAADAYALGATLFELLAGHPPFPGASAQVLLDKQTRAAPDVRAARPGVPEDLARLVDGWLVRDPIARPPVSPSPVRDDGTEDVFVGRGRELETLRGAFSAVMRGDTRVILLEGESGIGKSALVEHALGEIRARAPNAQIFVGRPSPKERVPFNAFDGALSHAISRASQAEGFAQRTFVHQAVRSVLEGQAARSPVVLWVDDLQWADEDSLALLLSLLRPPQLRPALFILSRRPPDVSSRASSALVLPCAREVIPLGPLDAEASLLLARRLGLEQARSASVAARAGGHPLFVRELCRRPRDRREGLAPAAAPFEDVALDRVLSERIDALPEAERGLLRLLAVSQAPLGEARLARAARRPRGEVASALERLRRAQLVRLDADRGHGAREGGYRTYHDRIREVVGNTLDPDARARAHGALLEALDDADDLPSRLEHLLGTSQTREAATVARQAAEKAAAVGAYTRAARLLEEALRTGCISGSEERAVRAERVELLERAHCAHEAAEEAVLVAAQTSDAAEADAYRMRAARHFLATGDLTRGREVLEGVLERANVRMPAGGASTLAELFVGRVLIWHALRKLGAQTPETDRAGASETADASAYDLLRAVADGLAMTDHVRGHLFQSRALRAALASTSLETRAEALVIEALYIGSTKAKGRDTAERYIAAARALFPEGGFPARARAWEDVARATFAKHERPSRDVVAKLKAAEQGVAALGGDAWLLGSIRLVRGHCLRLLGDLPGLRIHAGGLVEDAEARRDFFVLTTGHLGAVLVWLADDAPLAARQLVSQVKWPEERATFLLQHWLGAEAEVEISLYEGTGGTVLARLGPARSFLRFSLVKRIQSVRICCDYTLGRAIVAALEAGRASLVDRIELARVLRSLRRERTGYASARAAILEAGLYAARGDGVRALAALGVAEREGRAAELMIEPLVARWLRGFVSPTRRNIEGRARAEEELRALGVRDPFRFVRVVAPGFGRLCARDGQPAGTTSTEAAANR